MKPKHMFVLLRRNKENLDLPGKCIKHVSEDDLNPLAQIEYLEKLALIQGGVWRLYRSVNKRDFIKAREILLIYMIRYPTDHLDSIGSKWKSILMMRECRATKNWLLDIDTTKTQVLNDIFNFLRVNEVKVLRHEQTPNGHHIVTEGFDTREFNFPDVSIKKDDLLFLKLTGE